jgi:hypothetical protein
MTSLKRFDGYLMIDHRASPGVPEDIARKTGFDPKMLAEGKLLESATITCAHCLGVVVKHPMRIRPRGYCPQCDRYLCDKCEKKRSEPGYVHAGGEQLVDALLDKAANGVEVSGSPMDLLKPKIFVP